MSKTYIASEDTQVQIKNLVSQIGTKMGNVASDSTATQIKNLVSQINDKIGSTNGNGITPFITVYAPTGCNVSIHNANTSIVLPETGSGTGIYQGSVPHFGAWKVNCTKDNHTGSQTIQVTELTNYNVKTSYGQRYGYRIKKTEGNPYARVEYLFDAVGKTPAHMDFTRGAFSYGDWGDLWFITDNKPLMLKRNGTVDYYLKPDELSKKIDGTASDITNVNYDGNAMAQFPLVWVKRYEDNDYIYEIVSNVQYDDTYKAYAHTRADGSIADYFYWSIYGGSGDANKIRSLSGKTLANSLNAQQEINGCKANGTGWYTHTWSQHELIRTLLILMGKSTDTQSVFGNGNCRSASSAGGMLSTGTLNNMGQFFGYNDYTHQVKVFHVEKFWGDQWDRTAGLIYYNNKVHVKMTPEGDGYRVTDVTGYTNTSITLSGSSGGYISECECSKYGMIPSIASGSGTTYYCDGTWFSSGTNYLLVGASAHLASALGGAFSFDVDDAPSGTGWSIGCGLSCEQPAVA